MTFPPESLVSMLQAGYYLKAIGILTLTFIGMIVAIMLGDALAKWRRPHWESEFRQLMAYDEARNKRLGIKCCRRTK